MKQAEIVPVPAVYAPGYSWKWRCIDTKGESETAFALFFDCVSDARKHGYDVKLKQAQGLTAPGGAEHKTK